MSKAKKFFGNIIYWTFRAFVWMLYVVYVLSGLALVVALFAWSWIYALMIIGGSVAFLAGFVGAMNLYEASERWTGRSKW